MNHLFLHCRPGFEKETAAEITDAAGALGVYGYCKAKANEAYVLFIAQQPDDATRLVQELDFDELIFVRQWFACLPMVADLPVDDRVSPLVAAAKTLPEAVDLRIETVDTNEGKSLARLVKRLETPLRKALETKGCFKRRAGWNLHLVFLDGQHAFVGAVPVDNCAQWPSGIPRLRVPRSAPSRATLKLEEAWHHFIPAQDWDDRLAGGLRAVDLGAAPGGWTWQLVNRGMFVTAVDNGPMDAALMETGQVSHLRQDGFSYEPKKAVYWLVCDIADKPSRVAAMIARWVGQRWCKEAVFNLKLPMQQRYLSLLQCREIIEQALIEAGVNAELRFKHLYHDREEVTGYVRLFG